MSKNSFHRLQSIIAGFFVFIFSLWVYKYYQYGDQSHYRLYWETAESLSFSETYKLLFYSLGSIEPIYAVLTYIFSGNIEKDIIMSIINAVITYYFVVWALRNKTHLIIIPLLLLSSYMFVIFFPAERLKLAILFFLLALHYNSRRSLRYFFGMLAITSHVSILILISASYIYPLYTILKTFFRGRALKDSLLWLLFLVAGTSLVLYFFHGYLISKLSVYTSESGVSIIGMAKALLFMVAASVYTKERAKPIISGLPILLSAIILGPNRTIMFAYFYFLFYGLQYKRGLNAGILIIVVYFTFVGAGLVKTVIDHGDAFYYTKKIQQEAKPQ